MPIDLELLNRLEVEWKSLQPLESAREERLWQKLRLEWNYHSNHIEGNTLTYGETAAFLLHDQVSGTHSGREYDEMKGHDLAIKLVRELAASPQELTEADVRNLNQIILKEPFYKEAITPDGKASRKLITPGRYKEEPNSVETVTGEVFEYVAPMDVPARMTKLVEVIRNCTSKEGLTFMATLAITHHEFTSIHPFDDGNGRVVRLLTNYVLLKKGLPPLVIPSEKKKDYLNALRQADGGDPALLTDFFAGHLVWSLELGIRAGKGENLEDPRDVEKEITLFVKRKEEDLRNPPKVKTLAIEDLQRVWNKTLRPLFIKLTQKTQEIGKLFRIRQFILDSHRGGKIPLGSVSFDEKITEMPNFFMHGGTIMFVIALKGYRHLPGPFDIFPHVEVIFDKDGYKLGGFAPTRITKTYSEDLLSEEADEVVSLVLKSILRRIRSKEAEMQK